MTAITCPRCGSAAQAVRVDELTTHWRCAAEGCDPPGIYMGEHPAKFCALLVVGILLDVVLAVYLLGKRLAIWAFQLVADKRGRSE